MTINLNHVANQVTTTGSNTNIPLVFQSKGTGAIDLVAGSSGVNISNGGTVTAVTRTAAGSGYTSTPTPSISAPTTAGGVQATMSVGGIGCVGITSVASGGSGYLVGDVLTLVGGTSTTACQITVTAVSGGAVTGGSSSGGVYSVAPTNPVSVTGGSGTGCTLNLTFGVTSNQTITITNAGSGYVEQPTVSFSGGGGSGAAAYATVGSYAVIKSIGTGTGFVTNQAITFQTSGSITSGYPAFNIRDIGTGDSWYQMGGGSTSTFLIAKGNANASAYLGASGSGSVRFTTNGDSITEQMRVSHTASAVNYVQVTGAVTGSTPTISVQGSDADVGMLLQAKGARGFTFQTRGGGTPRTSFVVADSGVASVNYLQAQSNITGAAPIISALGSDTNIDLALTAKGTGNVKITPQATGANGLVIAAPSADLNNAGRLFFESGGGVSAIANIGGNQLSFRTAATIGSSTGSEQLRVSHTASAVNYVQVTGAATGGRVTLSAQGSDSNVGLNINAKGGGNMFLTASSAIVSATSGGTQFNISNTASAVNYVQVTGAAAGASPVFSVAGSDTNIDLTLTPKGTGNVVIGSAGLLVGTTTTSLVTGISAAKLSISGSGDGLTVLSGSGNDTINVAKSGTPSGTWVGFFAADGTGYGNITVNGAGTAYNTTSDYRLKNIDGPLVGAKDFIMALKPKQGTWKADGSKFVGFVADEFQQVSPTSVTGEKDAVDEEGKPVYQTMQASSSEVMANLIALVQEQQTLIENLTKRIDALK